MKTDMKSVVRNIVSKLRSISLTPIHHARRTVSGMTSKQVCIHLSSVGKMLMSILSRIAILMARGSLLSRGRIITLRNDWDTLVRWSIVLILSVANCVLKPSRMTDVTNAMIAPTKDSEHSSKSSSLLLSQLS
jgi:hypothetical protein